MTLPPALSPPRRIFPGHRICLLPRPKMSMAPAPPVEDSTGKSTLLSPLCSTLPNCLDCLPAKTHALSIQNAVPLIIPPGQTNLQTTPLPSVISQNSPHPKTPMSMNSLSQCLQLPPIPPNLTRFVILPPMTHAQHRPTAIPHRRRN